jgi:hypothetical protein
MHGFISEAMGHIDAAMGNQVWHELGFTLGKSVWMGIRCFVVVEDSYRAWQNLRSTAEKLAMWRAIVGIHRANHCSQLAINPKYWSACFLVELLIVTWLQVKAGAPGSLTAMAGEDCFEYRICHCSCHHRGLDALI